MSKTYVGDVGTAIVLDTGQDLAGASVTTIDARKPNGATVSWAATVVETTKVRFVTIGGTLDIAGLWTLQARVVLPSGAWLGESAALTVYGAFQ